MRLIPTPVSLLSVVTPDQVTYGVASAIRFSFLVRVMLFFHCAAVRPGYYGE